jgi:hypothetical protein
MSPRSLCAIVLALALPALGQTEPQLEPLVPPSVQKNKKKPRRKPPEKKAPSEQAQPLDAAPQGQEPSALPPLAPLTSSRRLDAVGVLVLGALPDDAAARFGNGIRAAVKLAPGVKEVSALDAPHPCADKACWVTAGVARSVHHVVVATYAARRLKIRLVDVKARKIVQEANRREVSSDPAEATAWAEALVCKLLVPAGCTGEAVVQGGEGIALQLDGVPLAPGEKRRVPVGVHVLRVKEGVRESVRPLPVLVEEAPMVTIEAPKVASATPPPAPVVPIAPLVEPVTPPPAPQAAAIEAAPLPPAPSRKWTRPAGYAAVGAAVVAAGVGAYFGAKSRSDLNDAESAYRANGNAYTPASLDKLQSGNSAGHTANALFIASGILVAAGAALTFAF